MKEEGCLAGAGGRNDKPALAAPNGCDDVHDAGGEALRRGLESDALFRIDGLELIEVRELGGFRWIEIIDHFDIDELGAAGAGLELAMKPLAVAQAVAADQLGRDENIFLGLFEVACGHAEEAEALGGEL